MYSYPPEILIDQSDPIDSVLDRKKGRTVTAKAKTKATVPRMAEPEIPTSSASTSATSTSISSSATIDQAGNELGSSQVASGSGSGAISVGEESGNGEVAGTNRQEGEGMQVQVDAVGTGNDQSEDMVIESGPSHIGKRVKVDHPI